MQGKPQVLVITGGVVSGLGKGTAAASIGKILKSTYKKIVVMKFDGYLNIDPGTMNPIEHGEVFVLDDGTEVDMDFGHYERFLDIDTKGEWNLTSGKIFYSLIEKERQGLFLGKTIQVLPHVINEIIEKIQGIVKKEKPDLLLIEVGGTVGDIENSWFIEAVRQLKKFFPTHYIHLTYIPFLENVGELKTKPAQRDINTLRQLGIIPDIIIVRSHHPINEKIRTKIAINADIDDYKIIQGLDVENIYEIPLMFIDQGIVKALRSLGLRVSPKLGKWKKLVNSMNNPKRKVRIAIAGKYTELQDSYASVVEAINHAAAHLGIGVELKWIETTKLDKERNISKYLKDVQGVIVPGGFGSRGIEGKIKVINYVRTRRIPFLGLCLGLQLAVIEYARNVCKLKANSTEFDKNTKHNVIDLLDEQRNVVKKGGTMRLGLYKAVLKKGTLVHSLYGKRIVYERHRHRYEVNPEYIELLEKNGLIISGLSPDRKLVEFIELPQSKHPFFVATQAHPELRSRLEKPSPLFMGFLRSINNSS